MFAVIVVPILGLIALASGAPAKDDLVDDKIVGGFSVTIDAYPYQLSLRRSGSHICGASIIQESWALTAAHCVSGISSPASISLRAGSTSRLEGGTIHNVAKIITHDKYNSRTYDYDFALLQVVDKFIFKVGVAAIPLNAAGIKVPAGTISITSGWGTTSSGGSSTTTLMAVEVPVVENSQCNVNYGGGTGRKEKITAQMLCAGVGGKDSCQGDSGGPLIAELGGVKTLIGVVSWGNGCADARYPGVYSNISSVRSWFSTNTANAV